MQKYVGIEGMSRVHALHLGNVSPHTMQVSIVFLYNLKIPRIFYLSLNILFQIASRESTKFSNN